MNQVETIPIKEYLDSKGIPYRQVGGELVTKCLFSGCDDDSKGSEAHLYFSDTDSTYKCQKCGLSGNIFTLAEFLGDDKSSVVVKSAQSNVANQVTTAVTDAQVEAFQKNIPPKIMEYLHKERGLDNDSLERFKIGYGEFYGRNGISIPVYDQNNNPVYFKVRKDPYDSRDGEKYLRYPKGKKSELFGYQILKESQDYMLITEGEFDCILANQMGIPAVTFTTGVSSFCGEFERYAFLFKNVEKLYVCFDKDEAGQKAVGKFIELVLAKLPNTEIYRVTFPNNMEGKDLTDYFVRNNGNIDELVHKLSKRVILQDVEKSNSLVNVPKPDREVGIEEWRSVIKEHFPTLMFSAELVLSVFVQLFIKDVENPFGLVLVGQPGSGKTIVLNFFSDVSGISFITDKFSAASFVSNAANVSPERLANVDLLPKIKDKVLIVRDLAPFFSKRDDDLTESIGVLTRVFDGQGLWTDSGVHGHRGYSGSYVFMFLAATTPLPFKIWTIMGSLGARLFFYNVPAIYKSEEVLSAQVKGNTCVAKEKICRAATKDFIYTLKQKYPQGIDWNRQIENEDIVRYVGRAAMFLSRLRGVVKVWKTDDGGDEFLYNPPVIEQPDRLNQLFFNLCRGHALICGRTQINEDDFKYVLILCINSAETTRSKLVSALIREGGFMKTERVEQVLGVSKPTALREMKILEVLELCSIQKGGGGLYAGHPEGVLILSQGFKWLCEKIKQVEL